MFDIIKAYKRHFLKAEFLLSAIISLIIIFYINSIWSQEETLSWISANKKELYPLIASIVGTLLGFVITGVSIIIAFSESEKLKLLKQTNHFKTIYNVYFNTIRYLAITTLTPIIGLIVNDGAVHIFYFLIWSIIISTFRIWRCVWVLENVIQILNKNN